MRESKESDEQFFEELAQTQHHLTPNAVGAASGGEDWRVELAKASGVSQKPKLMMRQQPSKRTDEGEAEGQLTIDVYQTPSEIVIESAIAGVRPEDLDIDVTTDSITVRGERHRMNEIADEDYFYRECYWGKFSRSVILPEEIDPENASVSFKNGILNVRLPKLNRKKSKKLKVKMD